ncbi:hypothetical protein SAMN04487976_12157 [Xaviernesmea oryzae]|nr:hypothetical protein SAMN04487976_12157 [Xaviernesmea oryzae]
MVPLQGGMIWAHPVRPHWVAPNQRAWFCGIGDVIPLNRDEPCVVLFQRLCKQG